MTLFWVALAGGLGAACRYTVDAWVNTRWGRNLPLGSVLVNVIGSFMLGFVAGWWTHAGDDWRLILGTGFCGGFTTFGTAMLESSRLLSQGRERAAFALLGGTVVVGVGAAAIGLCLAL